MSILGSYTFDSNDDWFSNDDYHFLDNGTEHEHFQADEHEAIYDQHVSHDVEHGDRGFIPTSTSEGDLSHYHWDSQFLLSDDSHASILGDTDDPSIFSVHQHYDPNHSGDVVLGDPSHEMQHWHHQAYPDSCAIAAQEFVLESLTGQHFSESNLCWEAVCSGCYVPGGGTPADHVGDLIEAHGFPVEHQYGCTMTQLADRLTDGEKVIVAVNEDMLENPDQLLSYYPGIPGQKANHAVEVIGLNYSNPENPMVILNDPGIPDGQGIMVPMSKFEAAWATSDHMMVSTTIHHDSDSSNVETHIVDDSYQSMMLGSVHYHHHYHHLVKRNPDWSNSDYDSSSSSDSGSDNDYRRNEYDNNDNGIIDPVPDPLECRNNNGDGKCDSDGGDEENGGEGDGDCGCD